jgi:hypothetical protein
MHVAHIRVNWALKFKFSLCCLDATTNISQPDAPITSAMNVFSVEEIYQNVIIALFSFDIPISLNLFIFTPAVTN